MQRHLTIGTRLTAFLNGQHLIDQTDAAAVTVMTGFVERAVARNGLERDIVHTFWTRHLAPTEILLAAQPEVAAEDIRATVGIWLCHDEHTIGAVQLHTRTNGIPNVKAKGCGDDRTRCKAHHTGDMGVDLDRYGLVHERQIARFGRASGHCRDRFHRAEQRNQCGQVVRAHVQSRAAARTIVERNIGMYKFPAMAQHGHLTAGDSADGSCVNLLAHGLEAASEEGIGCTTHRQTLFCRQIHDLLALGKGCRERFFGVNVLACVQGCQIVFGMHFGNGQIEHNIDFRVSQQRIDRFINVVNAQFLRTLDRFLVVACSATHNLNDLGVLSQVIDIFVADIADTDQCNFHFFHTAVSFLLHWDLVIYKTVIDTKKSGKNLTFCLFWFRIRSTVPCRTPSAAGFPRRCPAP